MPLFHHLRALQGVRSAKNVFFPARKALHLKERHPDCVPSLEIGLEKTTPLAKVMLCSSTTYFSVLKENKKMVNFDLSKVIERWLSHSIKIADREKNSEELPTFGFRARH